MYAQVLIIQNAGMRRDTECVIQLARDIRYGQELYPYFVGELHKIQIQESRLAP